MTDEERQRLVYEKGEVGARLERRSVGELMLCGVPEKVCVYIRSVIVNPDGHNLWEQLAVDRFFDLMDRYEWDSGSVERFFRFYEHLWLPGKQGPTRYALTPVQAFQFASVYGFRRKDGSRLVRTCVLYVPRKFSKTTGTAAFALWDLLFGDANAECYIGANSQDQARKCFDVIRSALRRMDANGRDYVVNKESILPTRRNRRQAFAQCLTANARTKDGLNASTVIMDEFSQARDRGLLDVLTTSMGVRENPLTVIITTASDVFEGPFYAMLQGYKRLLLGDEEDDSVFCHLFEPDVGDREDDPRTWRKVHPHIGVTVQEGFYEEEYRKARRDGSEAMLAFRTKLLNVYAENERKSWLPAAMIRQHSFVWEDKLPELRDCPMTVGLDLSVRDDFSAVSYGVYVEGRGEFYYKTDYYMPEGGVRGHHNEMLYRKWAEAGWLKIQDSEVIDYDGIVADIIAQSEGMDLVAIAYDPKKSLDIINQLGTTDAGWALRPFSQAQMHFTAGVQSFEVALRLGRLQVDRNPINAYCFGNAVLDTDFAGNMKPYKRTAGDKIDGVITMLMCHQSFGESRRAVI